jgi:PAS domain S-box-containing protein
MTEGFALHEIICDENGKPCDYRFLEINPSFERLTGLKREDVAGKLKSEVLPDDDPYWVEIYGAVALTGQPIHFENYSSALNRHYDVFAYCPAPRQFAVLFMNITERKQAEEHLAYQAHVLKNVRDAIIATDERLVITAWSRGAEETYGWTAQEALGQSVTEMLRSELAGDQRSTALLEVAEVGHYNSQVIHHHKDGRCTWRHTPSPCGTRMDESLAM